MDGQVSIGLPLLTPAMMVVTELVAQGLTNKEIAEHIATVTGRQISSHRIDLILGQIYDRLDLKGYGKGGKRVRLGIWWACRYEVAWCGDCPVHPVYQQELRQAPPRRETIIESYYEGILASNNLNRCKPVGYRGLCPGCLDQGRRTRVYGIKGKVYCTHRCSQQHWDRKKYRAENGSGFKFRGYCAREACQRELWSTRRKKWCSRQCYQNQWAVDKRKAAKAALTDLPRAS